MVPKKLALDIQNNTSGYFQIVYMFTKLIDNGASLEIFSVCIIWLGLGLSITLHSLTQPPTSTTIQPLHKGFIQKWNSSFIFKHWRSSSNNKIEAVIHLKKSEAVFRFGKLMCCLPS